MNLVRLARRWFPLGLTGLLGIACVNLLAQKPSDASGDPNSAKYVGAEVCQSCHEDQYKSFAQSAHVQTLKRNRMSEQGCEGCHGAGAAHVDAGDPDKIRRFADARPETIRAICTTCHTPNLSEAHSKARLTCLTCHSAHHYRQKAILVAAESELCQKCHRAPTAGRFHL